MVGAVIVSAVIVGFVMIDCAEREITAQGESALMSNWLRRRRRLAQPHPVSRVAAGRPSGTVSRPAAADAEAVTEEALDLGVDRLRLAGEDRQRIGAGFGFSQVSLVGQAFTDALRIAGQERSAEGPAATV